MTRRAQSTSAGAGAKISFAFAMVRGYNLPTQYRVTVTWLFPGATVRVEAPCLDCGEPVVVEMRDGRLLGVEPRGTVGHLNYGFGASRGRPPYL